MVVCRRARVGISSKEKKAVRQTRTEADAQRVGAPWFPTLSGWLPQPQAFSVSRDSLISLFSQVLKKMKML